MKTIRVQYLTESSPPACRANFIVICSRGREGHDHQHDSKVSTCVGGGQVCSVQPRRYKNWGGKVGPRSFAGGADLNVKVRTMRGKVLVALF